MKEKTGGEEFQAMKVISNYLKTGIHVAVMQQNNMTCDCVNFLSFN